MKEKQYKLPAVRPLPLELDNLKWWQKIVIWLTYRRSWMLIEDFIFFCPVLNEMVRIPIGFILDFASVPKAFYSFFNPTGFLMAGAIPHDFIYRHGGLLVIDEKTPRFVKVSRKEGDKIFNAMGKELGAHASYGAGWSILRIFGSKSYKPKPYVEGMYEFSSDDV